MGRSSGIHGAAKKISRCMNEMRNTCQSEALRLHVERVEKRDGMYCVVGWVTEQYGEAQLFLYSEDRRPRPFVLEKTERPDVVLHFDLTEADRAFGFCMKISEPDFSGNRLTVCLEERSDSRTCVLNAGKIRRKHRMARIRKRLRAFPAAARQIRETGWERFKVSRKRKEHPEYEDAAAWIREHRATGKELRRLKAAYGAVAGQIATYMIKTPAKGGTEGISWAGLGKEIRSDSRAGQWFLLAEEGICCEKELPFRAARYMEQNRDVQLIFFDHEETLPGKAKPEIRMKPELNRELLRSWNYIGRCFLIRRDLLKKIYECGMPEGFHDLLLKALDCGAVFGHIPRLLFHAGDMAPEEGERLCIRRHLERNGVSAEVEDGAAPGIFRIRRILQDSPLVSILILNKDHRADLETCIRSILEKTEYGSYEILIGENNSETEDIFSYYRRIQEEYSNIRVYRWEGSFNYSAINNMLAEKCRGEYLVLLNNDIEVISGQWLETMLGFCRQPDVGAVGAKLYYPDDTVQHAGVILGLGGIAGHVLAGLDRKEHGYMNRLITDQEITLITAACMMVRKKYYEQAGGMDERFQVAFNDADFCMKLRQAGLKNLFTPYAELYHYESKSRGRDNTPEKIRRFQDEISLFEKKWSLQLKEGDPFYSPVLTLRKNDCSFKTYEEEVADGKCQE